LGGVLGLVQGILIIGIIIFVVSRYVSVNETIAQAMITSEVVPLFLRGINWVEPLVPDALNMLQAVVIIN
jgi:uncharacterized membrane protein required for colicin V production